MDYNVNCMTLAAILLSEIWFNQIKSQGQDKTKYGQKSLVQKMHFSSESISVDASLSKIILFCNISH